MKSSAFTLLLFCIYIAIIQTNILHAQMNEVDTLALFNSEKPLPVTLTYDIKKLKKDKYKEEYQSALISFPGPDGSTIEKNIKVRARGNVRKRHCYFPPIKLNFKDTYFKIDPENPFKTLKVVTHCRNGKAYQEYVIKEYLAYKIWALLTDLSYKVRLAEITYIDAMEKMDPSTNYGLILEHTEHVAERNACIEIEPKGVHPEQTNRELMTLFSVYQYFIGNTDWSTGNLHNVKILKPKDVLQQTYYVVPYDFDYAGFVNTEYAIPDPKLGIKNVRDRLYQGYVRTPEELQKVFSLFSMKKQEIYDLVTGCEYMSEVCRKEVLFYMDEFYRTIMNPVASQQIFYNNALTNTSK